jgi:hypothetical protein
MAVVAVVDQPQHRQVLLVDHQYAAEVVEVRAVITTQLLRL